MMDNNNNKSQQAKELDIWADLPDINAQFFPTKLEFRAVFRASQMTFARYRNRQHSYLDTLVCLEAIHVAVRDFVRVHMGRWDSVHIITFGSMLEESNDVLEKAADCLILAKDGKSMDTVKKYLDQSFDLIASILSTMEEMGFIMLDMKSGFYSIKE